MQDLISSPIDTNKYSNGILMDLAKAFDSVDHNILLDMLQNYRIRVCLAYGSKAT